MPNLSDSDKLRLESVRKGANILQIKRTITLNNLGSCIKFLNSLYKCEIKDYAAFCSMVDQSCAEADTLIQRALEKLSLSNSGSSISQPGGLPVPRAKSLFSSESATASPEEGFGPGVCSMDRKKIEKLLENIGNDVEIKTEDRTGTPDEMKVVLLEHQKVGLAWLLKMEAGISKGGILADDMGLGKTIQTLSLLVANKSTDPQCKTTLIVAPVSLLKQWEREIMSRIKQENQFSLVSTTNKYFASEANNHKFTSSSDLSDLFPNGWVSSSKINKCLEIINNVGEKFPGEKVIVFSQFTSLLDFIEIALQQQQSQYLRYDGSMSANSRNQCVIDFFDKPDVPVLLISLKAGNVGLTLTCASHIIIMDPFWNPFVEEQAMDRAHRIGQLRPVFVHRLVIKDTVEGRILELQEKKKKLIEGALDETGLKSIGKLDQKELKFLFGLPG
ncbi:hypothetical protein DV451_000903 [Geotrichum candidum]|uniref:Helicase C-terminal domain-containing protein n=1 Tax=Geotrichum candidum TaxID=1173061 RepID=A0A9P5GAG2_GEOCN|nr:hypothetical protein DV451_000903 [Geotrichum candidum]KAF5106915.1 hypothetical protein DV453_003520 [Geotrichum candidum]KAF5116699.1 hypothetical protein DV454_001552 [Geotrichum candidum]